MSRLQSIENALSAINESVFQELCDSFLALRNSNYSAFTRTGSKSGMQKTIKGTPDTFLLLPNGKFIFVEYSTNISAGLSKLQDDIKKCLNTFKTGIPLNQIAEIILCINFNLKTEEIQTLLNLLSHTRILLTIYTLDSLSLELQLNHRDLTHQYLGLALDTGQIVSVEKFLGEYNRASNGISTPLDNTFLHREKEIKELNESIRNFDFIILTGAPGIGKTKLALKGIESFLLENLSYKAYCISYKNYALLDDLYQYLKSENDYLLFVDDANRIDAFSQITGFYKSIRKGKLKIIITVRDYAYQEIGILCQEFSSKRIDLVKFPDEQIVDIIEADPFVIRNQDFQKEIVRIADGNPKLAIMTALLAKAKQNIYALYDVSGLFEKYFSTFVRDDGGFASELNLKCLGLIAFFYTIPYKNKEIAKAILTNFGLDYSEFIDVIDKLEKLELVEIQFEHVKIPEQNLSTYFFYRAFIKNNLLSFKVLLDNYFDSNNSRFRDCVFSATTTFGPQNVMDKLQPDLKGHWRAIKRDEDKAFKFLNTFWYYLKTETFEFVFTIIQTFPTVSSLKYEVTYGNNAFSYEKNKVVELLGEYFHIPNDLKDALELVFEYIRKNPEHLPELIHKIREQLIFDREDERFGFSRQTDLFQILIGGLNKDDILLSTIFYELSKTFLAFKFQHTKGGRNRSFYFYDYPLPNIKAIQLFRKTIWEAIEDNYDKHIEESFTVLHSYAIVTPNVMKDVMEFDLPFVVQIINNHLSTDSFEHCRYVQDQIRWFKRNSVTDSSLTELTHKFTNPSYETFLKVDWDQLRDKESLDFENYREYEKLKEAEIRSSFIFNDQSEVDDFFGVFVDLRGKSKNEWNFNRTLDLVIDENCTRNFNLGCRILKIVIEKGNEINYIPRIVFRNQLKIVENAKIIWSIIQSHIYRHKSLWALSFFDYLDDLLLDKEYVLALVNTISSITEDTMIHLDRLQRFLAIEPNLFEYVLKIIVEKNEKGGIRLQVWMDFFSLHFNELGNDIKLIEKAYIQQEKIQSHFDYDGEGVLEILNRDPTFLIEYVNSLFSETEFGVSHKEKKLGFVWKVANIESILVEVFNLVIGREPYFGILDHFCNSFFSDIIGEDKEKAKYFLIAYCKTNFNDSDKINVIVDIVRHSMPELFEEILLLYLSLNQDVKMFRRIMWRGSETSGIGDVILADIEAAEWRNILSIVEKSTLGFKLSSIKKHLSDQIENCLRNGDWERQSRFLGRY